MRALTAAGPAMVLLGIAALVIGTVRGDVGFALVVIVPVVYGSGPWALSGGLLVLLGLAATFFSRAENEARRYGGGYAGGNGPAPGTATEEDMDQRRRGDFGGVVLLGPIPILFGSGRSLRGSGPLIAMAAVSAVLLVLFILGFLLR